MKLISQKFIRNIAPQLDLLNTIGGGVAEAKVVIDERPKGVIVHVAMPTVASDTFRVVLNERKLTVFSQFRHDTESEMAAPLFVKTLDLPANLDVSRIDAVHRNGELQVRIPFNAEGQQREIDVRDAE
jgi:HSP20 family protein